MGIEKAELKVLVADEIGSGLGEALLQAQARVQETRGAAKALSGVKDELKSISQAVVTEWKEGRVKLDTEDPSAVPKYVVEVLMLAARRIHDRAENEARSVLMAEGEVTGIRAAIRQVADLRGKEALKAQALKLSEASPDNGGPRPPGAHPGPTLKAQRIAEETEGLPAMNVDAPMPRVKPPKQPGRGSKKATRATHS